MVTRRPLLSKRSLQYVVRILDEEFYGCNDQMIGPEGLPLHRRVHGGRGQGRCCEQRARGVQPGHGGRDDGLGCDAPDPFGAGAELLGVPLRGELEKWLRSWLSGFHVHNAFIVKCSSEEDCRVDILRTELEMKIGNKSSGLLENLVTAKDAHKYVDCGPFGLTVFVRTSIPCHAKH